MRFVPEDCILANEWVFRNWVFGPVADVAGFIRSGMISTIPAFNKTTYWWRLSCIDLSWRASSKDGHIQSFHRVRFILPKNSILIFFLLWFSEAGISFPKDFLGKPNRLFTQILPRILPENQTFGNNYSEEPNKSAGITRKNIRIQKPGTIPGL